MLLAEQQRQGTGVVAATIKSTGIFLPPRAAHMNAQDLRTFKGQLDAQEMEGTASPLPPPPGGLAPGLHLGEYQVETVGWMLQRERSRCGIEDLFETRVGAGER